MRARAIAFIVLAFASLRISAQQAAQPPGPPPGVMADVASLVRKTNEERLEALKALLDKRDIAYTIEPFSMLRFGAVVSGNNLVVTLGSGRKDIVVGAHYDAARLPDGSLSQGAVDNGAAAVSLVRLAETLGKSKLRHRVRIVFFDLEEAVALGSKAFRRAHKADTIAAGINLDVMTAGDCAYVSVGRAPGSMRIARTADEVCASLDIPHVLSMEPVNSDQDNFEYAGIANVSISVLHEIQAHQLWLVENAKSAGLKPGINSYSIPGVHSPKDTVDAVNEESISTAHDVVLGIIRRLEAESR